MTKQAQDLKRGDKVFKSVVDHIEESKGRIIVYWQGGGATVYAPGEELKVEE